MVILCSGGLDSTVLMALALSYDKALGVEKNVNALGILYGQRHAKELIAAASICKALGVPYEQVDLSDLRRLWTGSSQTDDAVPVPHGHYKADTMKATVVPNRNLTMLSVAAGYALSLDSEAGMVDIGYAAHSGDHAIYADCRPEFIVNARRTLLRVDERPAHLWTPFMRQSKTEIVKLGDQLGAPLHLTWSCYEGGELHCGLCGTCVERKEAFQEAGVPDPTVYQ